MKRADWFWVILIIVGAAFNRPISGYYTPPATGGIEYATPEPTPDVAEPIRLSGDEAGVLEPVEIKPGLYSATLTVTGARGWISSEGLSGGCWPLSLMVTDEGGGSDEDLFTSDGCRLVFDVSANAPWSLELIPIR